MKKLQRQMMEIKTTGLLQLKRIRKEMISAIMRPLNERKESE